MKKRSDDPILVYADWQGIDGPLLMGELVVQRIRGREVFSFSYDEEWLQHPACRVLDPELQLYSGRQYTSEQRPNFGVFMDSSPDRWGRMLMKRREALLARSENRPEQVLFESDYLLGVFDRLRMGGLRFKTAIAEEFLSHADEFTAPPWASLRELEHACSLIEDSRALPSDQEVLKWLMVLLAPGSSLGGARPKAGVQDEKEQLWIAKFPSQSDDFDVGAWEMVVRTLAMMAGVVVPPARLVSLSGRYRTFLSKRFDRAPGGKRIHMASAMTLLGYQDGMSGDDGISYLELAEFILRNCANASRDLEQMWRRIVFNILVSNTDDHLRNHAFLLSRDGWILSPAYDMNPNPYGAGLCLNISETDNSLDAGLAFAVARYFKISPTRAKDIHAEVLKSIGNWHRIAGEQQIPRDEIERMQRAFRI